MTLTVTVPARLHAFSGTRRSLSVVQGTQGSSTITTAISGGFNSAISLSASGMPTGTAVSFSPNPIAAPGSGSSTMTITVGTSTAVGTYPITVTGNGGGVQQTATVTLTVTATPVLVSIAVTPVNSSIAAGNQQQFSATGTYSDGSHQDLTSSATWTSSAPSVATIATGGLATALAVGSTTIQGAAGSIYGSTSLTVTAGVVVDAVGPGNMVVNIPAMSWNHTCSGSNRLLVVGVAMGTSTSDASAVLSVTYAGIPMVPAGKRHANDQSAGFAQLFYLVAPPTGTNTVTVTETGYTGSSYTMEGGSTSFTGVNQTTPEQNNLSAVGYSPAPTLSVPSTIGHMVVDVVVGGSSISGSGQTLEWMNNENDNTGGGNAAQSTAAGAPSVTMSYTTGSDWWAVVGMDIVPANVTLVSVTVTPANASIAAGTQQQYAATGTYSDGSHQDLTSSATWTSSAPSVATIAGSGLATGVAAGSTTIQAASGANYGYTGLTVTAAPGGFTISASPASLSVIQGNQGNSTITTAISGGFNSAISLSASGMPTGTTVSFSPNPIAAPGSGSSGMTITVGTSTAVGSYPITVTGNGGGVQQSTTVTLTVTAAANFTISAAPASLSIAQGNQGTSTITTAISVGFNSTIGLSVSGMPAGATVSFNPQTIPAPGSGTSTMTITVGTSTPTGTYPITVTGNGGGIQQTATVALTVTAQGTQGEQVALSWTASTSPGIAGYNAFRSMTSGGPYTQLNSSLISNVNYMDQTAQSGNTYYYVTTAVNSQGMQSAYSNESVATVP